MSNLQSSPQGRIDKVVTALSFSIALFLVIIKLAAWLFSNSVAVLGSLADSGLDLVSSALAFFAVRWAQTPPDDNHRFGHQKAEAVSALVQTALIAASATFVLVESVRQLISPHPIERSGVALVVLSLSLALTLILVGIQTVAVRRSGNLVIAADRAHYAGDLLAGVGVIIAIVLSTNFGMMRADGLAGLAAVGFLIWSMKEVANAALPQLMDQELPDEERREIVTVIRSAPGVMGYHNLRTRRAGARRFIQVDAEMEADLTLSDAHFIAAELAEAIEARFPGADVLVHQDITKDQQGDAVSYATNRQL